MDFAEALTKAVDESGLSLDRIQHHLGQRGLQVSLSTLSYWRRGRSRPERPESLKVVTELEEILGLPDGDLTGRLGSKRPRGRWVDQPLTFEDIWEYDAADLMEGLDRLAPTPLQYVSVRDVQIVGADRRVVEYRSSGLIQALEDGVDRIVAMQGDPDGHEVGTVTAAGACRLGRVRTNDEHKFLMAEIVFDRRLRAGETALVDYRVTQCPGATSWVTDRRFLRPVRDYVLQIQFHPEAVPVRCYGYTRPSLQEPETNRQDLWIGTTASTHFAVRDAKPGIYGIRWEWE